MMPLFIFLGSLLLVCTKQSSTQLYDAITIIIQIFNMLVIAYITWLSVGISKNNLAFQKQVREQDIKPILNTFLTKSNYWEFWDSWYVSNYSKGAAVNTYIRFSNNSKQTSKWVACNTIVNGSIELFWIYNALKIEICYSDIESKNFYLSCIDNCVTKTEPVLKSYYIDIENQVKSTGLNIALLSAFISNSEDEFKEEILSCGYDPSIPKDFIDKEFALKKYFLFYKKANPVLF